MGTSSIFFTVCQWLVGDQHSEIRCSESEGPWWSTALVFTRGRLHYFSIYRWQWGRGSPANLISEITNHRVLDHLNLISVACKDHNTLLPPCTASISPPRLAAAGLPRSDERRGKSSLTKRGSWPHGVKRMWGMANSVQMMLWMAADSSCGGLAVGRERWPRWKLSVMIDGRTSVSQPSESALAWSAHCRRTHNLLL